ncbi:hypothetical protein Tco_0455317 [Tanacetum coccineum]
MSKYSTSDSPTPAFSPTSGSSTCESSFSLIISINITSPSSPFVKTNSVLDDWGTKPSDLKNELSLWTFSVMNATDDQVVMKGCHLCFLSSSPLASLFFWLIVWWNGLRSNRWVKTGVTKIVLLGLESVKPFTSPSTVKDAYQQTLALDFPADIVVEFYGRSRWKELSKETSSKILPCGDGSCWKDVSKPIARPTSLINEEESRNKRNPAFFFPICTSRSSESTSSKEILEVIGGSSDRSPWNDNNPFFTNRMVSDRRGTTLFPSGSSMVFL